MRTNPIQEIGGFFFSSRRRHTRIDCDWSSDVCSSDLKDTLNLPQTGFPMQAELVKNEPKRLQQWKDERLYEKVLTARASAPKWILHDGPPFADRKSVV